MSRKVAQNLWKSHQKVGLWTPKKTPSKSIDVLIAKSQLLRGIVNSHHFLEFCKLCFYVNLPKMNDFRYILNTLFTFKSHLLMQMQLYFIFTEIDIIHKWCVIYMTQLLLYVMLSKRERYHCTRHTHRHCRWWYTHVDL